MSDVPTMLAELVQSARLQVPDDLAGLFVDRGRLLGADGVTVYLVDHEQYVLVPVPQAGVERDPLRIETTLGGRCFRQLELQRATAEGRETVWVPLLDGLERLGVVELTFPAVAVRAADENLNAFAALIAELVLSKDAYGDLFHRVRRRQPMSLGGEIAWHLLPPLTFGTDRLVISAVLAPAYDVGGDSFDYAVDASTARFAVFDAMGHGLSAGLLATVAMGAYRNARRFGQDLSQSARLADAALAAQFGGDQFVTAILAELNLGSGRLQWHCAGHPAPLILRAGRVVKTLRTQPSLPLGLGDTDRSVAEEWLEPGDRLLLFTDGVTEARSADGEFFGSARLADFIAREDAAGQPAPETMRRLMHAILAHQQGDLQDDATAMIVEWHTDDAKRITP